MLLELIDHCFQGAGFLGHLVLLYVLIRKKRAQEFPIFTLFAIGNLVRTIALFPIRRYGSQASYFYSYWVLAIFDIAIQLLCTGELTLKVFRPRARWATGL